MEEEGRSKRNERKFKQLFLFERLINNARLGWRGEHQCTQLSAFQLSKRKEINNSLELVSLHHTDIIILLQQVPRSLSFKFSSFFVFFKLGVGKAKKNNLTFFSFQHCYIQPQQHTQFVKYEWREKKEGPLLFIPIRFAAKRKKWVGKREDKKKRKNSFNSVMGRGFKTNLMLQRSHPLVRGLLGSGRGRTRCGTYEHLKGALSLVQVREGRKRGKRRSLPLQVQYIYYTSCVHVQLLPWMATSLFIRIRGLIKLGGECFLHALVGVQWAVGEMRQKTRKQL